jgi:chromatin structure-remodeling complex subunit RSC1/2
VKKGQITAADAQLPDLGELPPVDPSPPPEDDEEGEDEEEEEEDEDDEDDDSDDEAPRRRRRRGRPPLAGKKDRDEDEGHRTRGRPPKVFTPLEARIQALLKGLRKVKTDDGELRIIPFERLPDKAALPDYYDTIQNPIALDLIKRKHKRKKYRNVDEVLADLELMFENAKIYNEEGSELYEDAVELQKQARILAEQEKAKPDDQFRDEDGKLPLAGIDYRGEIWRVGKFRRPWFKLLRRFH